MEENFNDPSEILQPEDWDHCVTDDDADIHVAEITQNNTDGEDTEEEVQVCAQEEVTVLADEDSNDDGRSDDLPEAMIQQLNMNT